MDLQPVLDRTAAMKYVSKYASKPEVTSDSYHHALATFCSRLPRHLPAERAVESLFAKMAADRDISAQEAVHLLLGEKLVGCSRSFVNLNADNDAAHAFTEAPDFDDNDAAFKQSFFHHYRTRPPQHEQYNAVQYCRLFDVNHRKHTCTVQIVNVSLIAVLPQLPLPQSTVGDDAMSSFGHGLVHPLLHLNTIRRLTTGHFPNCDCTNHSETRESFNILLSKTSFTDTLLTLASLHSRPRLFPPTTLKTVTPLNQTSTLPPASLLFLKQIFGRMTINK